MQTKDGCARAVDGGEGRGGVADIAGDDWRSRRGAGSVSVGGTGLSVEGE
jgi:hypothetical protein